MIGRAEIDIQIPDALLEWRTPFLIGVAVLICAVWALKRPRISL